MGSALFSTNANSRSVPKMQFPNKAVGERHFAESRTSVVLHRNHDRELTQINPPIIPRSQVF